MPRYEQRTQVKNSRVYDDTLTVDSTLETPAAANENAEFDLNALRSVLLNLKGQTNWFDAIQNGFNLQAIHDKILCFRMVMRPTGANASNFTIAGGPDPGVLVDASLFEGGAGTIGVGAGSVEDGGYTAALEANFTIAGTLGAGLSTIVDSDGTLLNTVSILDAATNDHVDTAAGEQIFGLLHALTGSADGVAIAAAASENLQISFVFIDKATDVITATTLPDATYHFAPTRQRNFQSMNRGMVLNDGALPSIIDPSGQGTKLPIREFDIPVGPAVTANDVLNIQTGVFTTFGATAVVHSVGLPVLPASGAAFVEDSRVRVLVNGQELSKGVNAAANRDVYWLSATTLAFEFELFGRNTIHIESPASF